MEELAKSGSKEKIRALLLSGLVCPGLGQLKLGRKKRGIFFICASIVLVLIIMVKILVITYGVITPEFMMSFSIESFIEANVRIRHTVYAETMPYILIFLGVWIAGIMDILARRS